MSFNYTNGLSDFVGDNEFDQEAAETLAAKLARKNRPQLTPGQQARGLVTPEA